MSNPRATTASAKATIPTAIKCSYRSKPCNSVRATKMNGDFHKLCEYHRRRANLNQQRVHQRRKLREYGEKKQQQQQQQKLHQDVDRSSVSSPSSVSSASFSWMAFAATSDNFFPTSYDDEDLLLSDSELDLDFEFDYEFACEPSLRPCGDLPLPDLKLLELLLSDNADEASTAVTSSQPECRLEFLDLDLLEA